MLGVSHFKVTHSYTVIITLFFQVTSSVTHFKKKMELVIILQHFELVTCVTLLVEISPHTLGSQLTPDMHRKQTCKTPVHFQNRIPQLTNAILLAYSMLCQYSLSAQKTFIQQTNIY